MYEIKTEVKYFFQTAQLLLLATAESVEFCFAHFEGDRAQPA